MDVVTLQAAVAASKKKIGPSTWGLASLGAKLLAAQNVKVTLIGDSGLEGRTVSVPDTSANTGLVVTTYPNANGNNDMGSLLCEWMATTYGVTVTKTNRAISGYSAYWPYFVTNSGTGQTSPTFTMALADAADLYVIAFGHNDIRSQGGSLPATGYPLAASLGAVEHMIARIRADQPQADIVVSSEWPYTGTSFSSDATLITYNQALQALCAFLGVTFLDFHGVLHDLGVGLSSTVTPADSTYICQTSGQPYAQASAQHPLDAGHALWAQIVEALLPPPGTRVLGPRSKALPLGTLYGRNRYSTTEWVLSAYNNGVRNYNGAGATFHGTGWTAGASFPQTTATATDNFEFLFIGSECALQIDTGGGQGTVNITIDGALTYSGLNLATQGSGQTYLPLTGLGGGVHRVVVALVSGSVTVRSLQYMPIQHQRIDFNDAVVAYSGTWTLIASTSDLFDRTNITGTNYGSKQTAAGNAASVIVEFVGTALSAEIFQYANGASQTVTVAVDGAAGVNKTWGGSAGGSNQHGGQIIVSGLPYGKHTVTLTPTSSSRILEISCFVAYDETNFLRPFVVSGSSAVGDTVNLFPVLPSLPLVTLANAGAATAPAYISSAATSGFVVNGTAGIQTDFTAQTARVAY